MNPSDRTGTRFRPSPIHFAITLAVLTIGVIPLPRALTAARESAQSIEPNRADREATAGGYYEGLIDGGDGKATGSRSELSLRLMGKPVEWVRIQAANVSRPIPFDFLQFDLKPSLDQPLFNQRFTTNRLGMRDRETTVAKPEATFRIALLGSSIDMGWGVDVEETYENLLEDWLNTHAGLRGINRRFEVLNFAVAAYGPAQRYAVLGRKAAAFSPDMVIYAATMLDSRLLELHLGGVLSHEVDPVYPFLKQALADAGITAVDTRTDADHQFLHKDALRLKLRAAFWPISDAILGALAADCRSMDVPLVMVTIPRAGKGDSAEFRASAVARISGIAARHTIPLIDLTPAFDRFDAAQVAMAPWDDHPNAFGHRRIFLGLARALVNQPDLYRSLFGEVSDAMRPAP